MGFVALPLSFQFLIAVLSLTQDMYEYGNIKLVVIYTGVLKLVVAMD